MDDPFLFPLVSNDLQSAIARRAPYQRAYRQSAALPISPWVAASLLQKAIRRGRLDLALQAAATLLAVDPRRLWRRLACIGAEDIGLGDLNALGLATAALAGKRRRAEWGGDWTIACCVVDALAAARKCRAADDLLLVCALHPALSENRSVLRALSTVELIQVVLGSEPFLERALALYYALGGDRRSREFAGRRSTADGVFDALGKAAWPTSLVECARQNYLRTSELLAPFVLLLSREAKQPVLIEADERPPEAMIGAVPTFAYDVYSREGKAALARLLKSDAPSAIWLRKNVSASRRMAFLGHIVFRVEGGLVDNRLRWPLGDWLRREVDISCSHPDCADASEILALVRADIPRLNDIRAELLRGAAGRHECRRQSGLRDPPRASDPPPPCGRQ